MTLYKLKLLKENYETITFRHRLTIAATDLNIYLRAVNNAATIVQLAYLIFNILTNLVSNQLFN